MSLRDPQIKEITVYAGADAIAYHNSLSIAQRVDLGAAFLAYQDLKLVAAAVLDVVATAAGVQGFGSGLKRVKVDGGDVELERFAGGTGGVQATQWAERAARLRNEVLRTGTSYRAPLAGMRTGNIPTPTFVRTVNPDPVQLPTVTWDDPEHFA